MNSAGSAMQENERYLDSIQGKIDKFTNSLQTFWMDAINSDFVKGVVNIGTTILNILDVIVKKAGIVFPTIGALITKHLVKNLMDKNGIKGLSGIFSFAGGKLFDAAGLKPYIDQIKKAFTVDASSLVQDMVSKGVTDYSKYAQVIQSLSAAKQAEVLINSELAESEQLAILTRTLGSEAAAKQALAEAQLSIAQDKVSLSQLAQLANTGALTVEQAGLIASTLGLSGVEGGLTEITKAEALAKVQAAVAAQTLSAADAEAIISTLGLSGATTVGVVGFKALAVAIWDATKAIMAFLFTNPVGWFILLTGTVIGLVAAYNTWGPTHKYFVKQLEEESKTLEETRSKIKDLNSELQTTKQRIEELENKESPSFADEEELKKLKAQNDELERQIKLEQAREQRDLQKQLTTGLNAAKTDKNFKDEYGVSGTSTNISSYAAASRGADTINIGNQYDQNLRKLEQAQEDLKKANDALAEGIEKAERGELDRGSKEFKDLEKAATDAQKQVDDYNTTLDNLNKSFTETYGDIGYQEILDSDSEALKQFKEQWNEFYKQQQMYQNKQALLNGTFTKADVIKDVFGSTGSKAAQDFNESFNKEIAQDIFYSLAEGTEYAQEWMDKLKETSPQTAQELEHLGITAEDIAKYFIQIGEEAKKAAGAVENSLSDIVTDLSSFEKGLTDLSEAYNEFLEKGSTTASTFEDLKETFNVGEMTDEYENFVRVLGDSTSTIGEVEAAIEKLVTAYFESLDLSNIMNEADMAVVVNSLNKLGVKNAKELVASKTEAYKQISDLYNVDLQNFDNAEEAKIAIEQSKKNQITSLSAEEINELAEHYGVDVGNFKSAEEAKLWIENDLANAVLTENASLIDQLATKYGIDLKNFDDMNRAKVNSAKEAAKEIARVNAIAGASKAYSNVINEYSSRDNFDPNDIRQESLAIKKAGLAYDSVIKAAMAEAEQAIDDIVFISSSLYNPTKALSDYYSPIDIDMSKFKQLGAGSNSGSGSDSGSGSGSDNEIDWIEVLFKRIDNALSEHEGNLVTVIDSINGLDAKDDIYDAMLGQMYNKANSSLEAVEYYRKKAEEAMSGLSADIQNKIRNGDMDIQEFKSTGNEEADKALEDYVNKINQAVEYYDKISEYQQQYYSTLEEIADKAVERQNEAATAYENEIGLTEHLNSTLEARNDLEEAKNGFATEAYYKAQIDANNTMLKQYQEQRKALQQVLDEEVAAGRVKIGSQQWFDMLENIYACDDAIIDMEASIEDLQNSINDLKWARFDELINRFGYIEDEISNVIQLLSHDPNGLVAEELRDLTTTNWATGSGLASLGLYAQEMERSQYVANQYADAIKELKKDYAAGRYNETEYLNKLNELINSQYENIEKYYDAKDAIIELNKARVDAIRDGVEKEIKKYSELIDKKKELLNKEQD